MRGFPLIFFIFMLACSSRPTPEWITSQPKTEGYWFGIGIVEKPFYGNDCRELARSKALSETAAQISVDISASFENMVTEHNLDLDEFSKSVIQTRVDNNLPNIEIMDFYESKDMCSLLIRLSKSTYYQTIERQRRNAVQSALGLLAQAESDFNVQTFTYLGEAISEIVPYMDIPIEEEYPAGSGSIVNLYSYIKLQANTSINRLSLVPDQEIIEMKRGFTRDVKLSVRVLDKHTITPIENIPITCYIDKNEQGSYALTDTEGNCIFPVPPIKDDKQILYINYEVNIDKILKNTQLFGALSHIRTQTTLKITPPQIFIQISENNLGKATDNPYIKPVITEFFAQHYSANFVDTIDADLIIKGSVNTRATSDVANDYGMYQVFGDMTISILNGKNGQEILSKSFNKIQGSDFQSNREAANHSLKKMSEKITEDFLPEIIDLLQSI